MRGLVSLPAQLRSTSDSSAHPTFVSDVIDVARLDLGHRGLWLLRCYYAEGRKQSVWSGRKEAMKTTGGARTSLSIRQRGDDN